MENAGPELDRLALIKAGSNDEPLIGTGYLVAPGLVMTAGHVVKDATAITVEMSTGDGTRPAKVLWLDKQSGVAFLAVDSIAAERQMVPALFNSDPRSGSATVQDALAVGFPRFAQRADGTREVEQVFGKVAPLSGTNSGTFEFLVESAPGAAAKGGVSPWSGMAGAPLWIDGQIAGVITQARSNTRLSCSRIQRLLTNPEFVRLISSGSDPASTAGQRDRATDSGPKSSSWPASGNLSEETEVGRRVEQVDRIEEAETRYRRSAEVDRPAAARDLGHIYKVRGDLDEAEIWYRRSADSGDPGAMRALGRLLKQRGDLDEAEIWYRRSADSGDPGAVGDLGRLLEQRGDLDEAEIWYRQSADSGDPGAVGDLGRLLEQRGDLEGAQALYERSVTMDPGDAGAVRDLGHLLEQRGDLEGAGALYERSVTMGGSDAASDLRRLAKDRAVVEEPLALPSLSAAQRSRLSPSSLAALAYADGLRSALGLGEVHMEHLLLGLNQGGGPTQRLLDQAGIGQEGLIAVLAEAVALVMPKSPVVPSTLESPPPLSGHVVEALDHAAARADALGSPVLRSRHLLHGALSVDDCDVVQALAKRGVHPSDIPDLAAPLPSTEGTFVRPPLLAGAAADTVPEPGEGRVRAADRLGYSAEVEMLVSVLLAKDTPLPLAVGLFGDWGSGKSFFMALMQERIGELAGLAKLGRPEALPFCREVRQVRFNAWHYVDTNLWASLAATLFDELARADAPDETQTKLTQLDEAREKVGVARTKREQLQREIDEMTAVVDRPTTALHASVSVVIGAVRGDRHLRRNLKNAADSPEAADPSTERLVSVLGKVDNTAAKARVFWRLFQEEVLYRRSRVTLVSLVVLVGLAALTSVASSWPPGAKFLTLVGAMVTALLPAFDGALRVLYLARDAREARELPLVEKRDELAQAAANEDNAQDELAERERELAELRDKGLQLQKFVRERAASSDYREKLGVISQVRRDFEQPVAMVQIGQPADAHQIASVAAAVAQRVPEAERIVLFIDDLDRCPHDKVVEVLQAVHLLLAFKLFVVVVGVDSRWLERSLRVHYQNLLEEPSSYLEKIFQIPFTLQRMTPPQYRELIDELTPPQVGRDSGTNPKGDPIPDRGAAPQRTDQDIPRFPGGDGDVEPDETPSTFVGSTDDRFGGATASLEAVKMPLEPPPLPRPEALVISDDERALLGRLGGIVRTPRATKRLVNIYRMLRVSVPDDELEAFRPGGGNEYQAVVLLLGVLIGRPSLAPQLFSSLMASANDDDVWQVLSGFPELHTSLAPLRAHVISHVAPYRRWALRVSRFSFRLAGILPTGEDEMPVGEGVSLQGSEIEAATSQRDDALDFDI